MNQTLSFQKTLFDTLAAKYKNKRSEIGHYQLFFGLTRSAIYDRRSGKIPISFDEGISLMLDNDLSPNIIPEVFEKAAEKSIRIPQSLETAPQEYLSQLLEDIGALARSPNSYLWHKTNDLPIFLLKHSRALAAFKLYYWLKVLSWAKKEPRPEFSVQWMQRPDIAHFLDQGRAVLASYQNIPGTEIWTQNMFDATIAQIRNVVQTGGMSDPALVEMLYQEMQKVVKTMRKMAQNANKDPEGGKADLKIYENQTFLEGSIMLGESEDGGVLYFDVGYPDFIRHTEPRIVGYQRQRLQNMLPQLEAITGNERNVYAFFSGIEKKVEQQFGQII